MLIWDGYIFVIVFVVVLDVPVVDDGGVDVAFNVDTNVDADVNVIVVVSVKGWKVVTRKNEYKVGDLAVYYEIDSFLPIATKHLHNTSNYNIIIFIINLLFNNIRIQLHGLLQQFID